MASAISCRYHWPEDSEKTLGLQPDEIRRIEKLLAHTRATKDFSPHASYTIDRKAQILVSGEKIEAPRRLVIYKDYSLVVLNSKGGLTPRSGGGQQRFLKIAYDPDTGTTYFKKAILCPAQTTFIQHLFSRSLPGCATIGHLEIGEREGKSKYFEQYYPEGSLARYFKDHRALPPFAPDAVLILQDTLKAFHETRYRPPALESQTEGKAVSYERHFYLSHADVSPNNLVLEKQPDGTYLLKWIDWGCSLNRSFLTTHTIGWGPPETIRGAAEAPIPHDKIDSFGTKKDAWSFALLAGSILLGDFYSLAGAPSIPLPNFRFVYERIRLNQRLILEESALGTLSQEEVDREVDGYIIASTEEHRPLWIAIKAWLRIDPNERPNLATCYVEEGHLVNTTPPKEQVTPEKRRPTLDAPQRRSSLSTLGESFRKMFS